MSAASRVGSANGGRPTGGPTAGGSLGRLSRWTHSERGRAAWSVGLVVLTWAWVILPALVSSLLIPKRRQSITDTDAATSPIADRLTTLLIYALLVACVVLILLSLDDLPRSGLLALFVLLVPWMYMVGHGVYLGERPRRLQLVYPLLVIAFWVVRPRLRQLSVLGYLVGFTALLSVFMGLALPSRGLFQSAAGLTVITDKQIISSGILAGPFDQGNTLAQFLVMGVATVALIRQPVVRIALLAVTAYALVWSASRSCLFALAFCAVVALALAVVPPRSRPLVGCGAVFSVLVAIVTLPLVVTDPQAFTNRGYIWKVSLDAWSRAPLVGRGTNFYSEIAATSANLGPTVFHAHNQFLQLLTTGGIVYVLLFAVLLAFAVSAAARQAALGLNFGFCFLASFLGACLLEVSFPGVDRTFLIPTMTVPLAFLMFARPGTGPPTATELVRSGSHRPARQTTPV